VSEPASWSLKSEFGEHVVHPIVEPNRRQVHRPYRTAVLGAHEVKTAALRNPVDHDQFHTERRLATSPRVIDVNLVGHHAIATPDEIRRPGGIGASPRQFASRSEDPEQDLEDRSRRALV
jgi:hypothetical protein